MKKAGLLVALLCVLLPVAGQNTAVYLQAGSPILEAAAAAIKASSPAAGLSAPAGPVLLAANKDRAVADLKDLKDKSVKYLYSVGTGPTVFATQDPDFAGIYVFIPNPAGTGLLAHPKWSGVSPYPDPRLVMQYLRTSMGLQKVAVLYTRSKNQEVAKAFQDAADSEKVACVPLGFKEGDDLDQTLGAGLKDAQAVLLLIDPLAFGADQVRFIVSKCLQAKKPVIGFLENLPEAGVPFAIFPPADEFGRTAAAAMKALQDKGEDRRIWYPQRFVMSINQAAAQSLGVPYDSQKVVKAY